MTEFADKARQGRLAALAGLGHADRFGAGSLPEGTRSRAMAHKTSFVFSSQRAARQGAAAPL